MSRPKQPRRVAVSLKPEQLDQLDRLAEAISLPASTVARLLLMDSLGRVQDDQYEMDLLSIWVKDAAERQKEAEAGKLARNTEARPEGPSRAGKSTSAGRGLLAVSGDDAASRSAGK